MEVEGNHAVQHRLGRAMSGSMQVVAVRHPSGAVEGGRTNTK